MCSVLEEDFMIEEKPSENTPKTQVCKKCQAPDAPVVLRKKDFYCKECFLAATTHKFRAMLGKYRIIKPNEKVLVVYRLGHPSTVLLHMIRSGLDLSQHKKLGFEAEYIFIDDFEESIEEVTKVLQQVHNQIESFNFKVHFVSLRHSVPKAFSYEEYIGTLLNNSKTNNKNLTSQQDITEINRRNVTIAIAKQLGCNIVLTPEISIDTTVGILTNVALGRGSQISLNVGIIDDRDSTVKIFTPLRLFEIDELEYYNDLNNLSVISFVQEKCSPYDSVQNLMKKFVEDLSVNYPSTIKTVTRTGDKLTYKKNDNVCLMCRAPIVDGHDGLSTSKAVDFSKVVSKRKIDDLKDYDDRNDVQSLCYACSKLKIK